MDYVAVPNLSSDSNLPVNDNAQPEVRYSPASEDIAENDDMSSQSNSTAIIESDTDTDTTATDTTATLSDTDEIKKSCLSKKRKILDDDDDNNDNNDDGSTCPICFDSRPKLDEHRLCALECGHIFGVSCLLRWFSLNNKKICPTCKTKACDADIRYIYARRLMALDVTELEEIKNKIRQVTQEKRYIQRELTRSICKGDLLSKETESLRQKLKGLNSLSRIESTSSVPVNFNKVSLYMNKSLEICSKGGCRVMGYCESLNLFAASVESPNNLFPGYGVRKIDVSTCRPTAFIPLHNLSIRDISFHSQKHLLLTVSLDKMMKIVDTRVNMAIARYNNNESQLWSCCWDANDTYMFYVGKQLGSISKFDIRSMSSPITFLEIPGDLSPVVSVASVPVNSTTIPQGGIISCKLNSLWLFRSSATLNTYESIPLPVEGPFISMRYENENILVSSRSNSQCPYTRHRLCKIEPEPSGSLICNTVQCFTGSSSQKLLSRSCFVSNEENTYVAAYQEGHQSVILWNTRTGLRSGFMPAREPVLDLCGLNANSSPLLAALTAKKINFFKFSNSC